MASIASMSWAVAEDLFSEVDFDFMYQAQIRRLGAPVPRSYPYSLLVHTGRILISISLANWAGLEDGPNARGLPVADSGSHRSPVFPFDDGSD
jgi:hypothetical protein